MIICFYLYLFFNLYTTIYLYINIFTITVKKIEFIIIYKSTINKL